MRKIQVLVFLFLLVAVHASAQERKYYLVPAMKEFFSEPGDTLKKSALDGMTYVTPALLAVSSFGDWNSSQRWFKAGYRETNYRLTISGKPNDIPVSYGEGRKIIIVDTIKIAGWSFAINAGSRGLERVLVRHFPDKKREVKIFTRVARTAASGYAAWYFSKDHFGKWIENNGYMPPFPG